MSHSNRTAALAARYLLLPLTPLLAGHPARADEDYASGEIILALNAGYTIEEVNGRWGTTALDSFPAADLYLVHIEDIDDLEGFAGSMEDDEAVLEADANYLEDTPEGIRQMIFVAIGGTMGDFEDQALTERIGLDEAHAWSRGAGVTVAVLDTGVDPTHDLFQGDRLRPDGYDFVDDDPDPWETANGLDDDGDALIDESHGHGSMVAGIVALVAPEAEILPIRALDDDGRSDTWRLVKAIRYAVLHGADVINMSFGVPQTISPIGHQIEVAEEAGIIVVAGAGNENRESPPYYPAADEDAFMITALDSMDIKADFADYNSKVLVSAPGTGVRSAYPGNDWAIGSGCSFATPFVAGEAALILSLVPGLDEDDIKDRIRYAVDAIYDIPENEPYNEMLGSGRIYLPLAVQDLVTGVPEDGDAPAMAYAAPNPTHGAVRLRPGFDAAPGGRLEANIFDVSGRLVRRLSSTGRGPIAWDGLDGRGHRLPAGVYIARIAQGAREQRVAIRVLR